MQVQQIKSQLAAFQRFLENARELPEGFRWEALQQFQQHWDTEAPDLAAMYDRALQNSRSRRLWKGENYFPKQMMIAFMQLEPDFCRRMFRFLYDEEKSVEVRISHVKFCCDELLATYKKAHESRIDNRHFHEDHQMISLYLGFRYPTQYTLFNYPIFKLSMEAFGAKDLPGPYDIERYIKVVRILNNFLIKEEALVAAHHRLRQAQLDYMGQSLLIVADFMRFVAGQSR